MKKNSSYVILGVAVIIILLLLLQRQRQEASLLQLTTPSSISNEAVANSGPIGTNQNTERLTNAVPAHSGAFQQGNIGKEQAILSMMLAKNGQSQDFYGKVIDQYGQSIPDVVVSGTVILNADGEGGITTETNSTKTDAAGLFQFTGLHGTDFNAGLKKQGYLMGAKGEGFKGPSGEKTNPEDRAIFTMWKLRGAEKLISYTIDAKIPFDGTPTTFDLRTQKVNPEGDLRVSLLRSPLEVERSGQTFDWSVKIEMLQSGGILAEADPYPYWAPSGNYVAAFEQGMASNNVPWESHLLQNFYIRNTQGQYGILQASIYTALTPARIQFRLIINPSGSQNLEPSP